MAYNAPKRKGTIFEREIVHQCENYEIPAKRAYASNGLALGLTEDVDVLIDNEIRCQAKIRKRIAKWLKPNDTVDIQVVREDRGKSYVIIRLEDYLCDLKRFKDLKKEKDKFISPD